MSGDIEKYPLIRIEPDWPIVGVMETEPTDHERPWTRWHRCILPPKDEGADHDQK